MASQAAIKAGEAFVQLTADDSRLTSTLRGIAAKVRVTGEAVRRAGGSAVLAGVGLGAAMTPAVAKFVAFDDAILAVRAKTGATGAEFDALRAKALELGRTTSFTADQVAGLMGELGTAGFKPAAILEMTESVLALSRATGTDATESAGIMSAAMAQFSLDATQAARVADALTVAANESFTNVTDLGEALKYSGTTAAGLGMSLEQTLALLGALGNVGVRGSQAGTTLQRLAIMSASDARSLRRLFGVEATDAAGNLRPLVDVLNEIQQSMEGLGNAERAAKLNEFFGLLGITGAAALGQASLSVRGLEESMARGAGTAARTAAEMDSGAGGAWRRLKGAAEGAAIAFGEAVAPALGVVGKVLGSTLGLVTGWIKSSGDAGTAVVALTVALLAGGLAMSALGVALGGLATGFAAVAVAVKAVIALLGLLLSPVGLAVAAVGGLAYAFFKFTDVGRRNLESLSGSLRAIGDTARETFGGIAAAVKKGDLSLAFDILTTGLRVAWLQLVELLRSKWYDFTNFFRDAFNDACVAVQRFMLNLLKSIRVGFLDAIIGITEKLNELAAMVAGGGKVREFRGEKIVDLTPEQEAKFKEAFAPLEKQWDKLQGEDIILRAASRKLRDETLPKLREEQKTAAPGSDRAKEIGEEIARAEGDLADLDRRVTGISRRMADIANKGFQLRLKILAGDKWIDTAPLEEARKAIEDETAARVRAIEELNKKEREARDKGQEERLAEIRKERDELQAELRRLIALANAPPPEVAPMPRVAGALPVAPMPRAVRPVEERFGDAVRGVFQSADFAGSLGIGASGIAKQQLDATKDVVTAVDRLGGKLDAIEKKIEPPTWT